MEPVRVIQGNLKPGEPFWNIRDAASTESGEAEVEFFGPISEYSWWGDEITPKAFKDELYKKAKGGPVTLKVNSPGGEVFAASAIRSILQDYPSKVTADIIGLAASAATFVVSGADHVRMRDTSLFMIHDPSTVAWGTADEFEMVLTVLRQVKESILNGYEAKTGKNREFLSEMMKEETWLTAEEAKELGFVDEVVSGNVAKAPAGKMRAGFLNCLQGFAKAPEGYLEDEGSPSSPPSPCDGEGAEEENVSDTVVSEPEPVAENDGEVESLRNYLDVFGPKKGGETNG
jgi:ATP-dependent Clp protease, protease subunit